jgi:hypothetical protein
MGRSPRTAVLPRSRYFRDDERFGEVTLGRARTWVLWRRRRRWVLALSVVPALVFGYAFVPAAQFGIHRACRALAP